MANEASRFLNLQLHRARLLYKSLAALDQESELALASRQSFMRQLNYCYRVLLLELAAGQLPNEQQYYSATELVAGLEKHDVVIPELLLLVEGEQQWVWLRAILDSNLPFVELPAALQTAQPNTIQLSQVDDYQRDNYSLQACEAALSGLIKSAQDCRETSQEW